MNDFSFNYKRIFNSAEAEQEYRDNWDNIDWSDKPITNTNKSSAEVEDVVKRDTVRNIR